MKLQACLALLILTACSNEIRVYTDRDPDYDLWTYKTFDWSQKADIEKGNNPLYYNELNDKRIKTAVSEELVNRGFAASTDNPDLMIHYHIIVDDQSMVINEPYGHYGPYWTHMHTSVYAYREGTLIIDLMDQKTNNLIWRGWAESAIEGMYDRERVDHLIKASVEKIFRKFPKPETDEREPDM